MVALSQRLKLGPAACAVAVQMVSVTGFIRLASNPRPQTHPQHSHTQHHTDGGPVALVAPIIYSRSPSLSLNFDTTGL